MKPNSIIIIIVSGIFLLNSCSIDKLFEQPTIEVTGFSLLELPGDYTHLEISMLVTNNDRREAYIQDIEYQVDIDTIHSETEQVDINQTLLIETPLELTLPLTLVTRDAIKLLVLLDEGEELEYSVTGTFHVDEPVIDFFDLPIDIQGVASVEVGFEDFYEQPDITVNEIWGIFTADGFTSYTFDLNVDCTVENVDARAVIIDDVEYVVYVEGVKSETHFYSDSYDTNINIAGTETISLTLPVELNLGVSSGSVLLTSLLDGTAEYVIEGTFHAIDVDGAVVDFNLPLYSEGSVPANLIGK